MRTLKLVDKIGNIKNDLQEGIDYVLINQGQWDYLKSIHNSQRLIKLKNPKNSRKTKSICYNSMNLSFRGEESNSPHEEILITVMDEKFSSDSIEKCSETDTISILTSKFMKKKIGLDNPGLYCYLNSAIQCILSISSIIDYFLTLSNAPDVNSQPYCHSIYQLINDILLSNNNTFHPSLL